MDAAGNLKDSLLRIEGQSYRAYKNIRGCYQFDEFVLSIDHVQGDPFAAPSRFSVRVNLAASQYPEALWSNQSRSTGFSTFLALRFSRQAQRRRQRRGSGKSGFIGIDTPGQEILERTCMFIHDDHIKGRFFVGLPATGRRVRGSDAVAMIFEDMPQIILLSLFGTPEAAVEATRFADTNEDADSLRSQLKPRGLVAFVGDGSILPRRSGIEQAPLDDNTTIAFESPFSMQKSFCLPNRGLVSGMGVPEGITLVVGGGFHGKSTLLQALQSGVYNHVPGDGRELVVTDGSAIKVRAEDGRYISSVNVSPFLDGLPDGSDTQAFSTANASGSTSQAASTVEAIEVGSRLLLVDEDTCATNFMARDHRMQQLVAASNEPIIPLIDRLRALYEQFDLSAVLVAGSNGDFFDVADTVIVMENYVALDCTEQARAIAVQIPSSRRTSVNRGLHLRSWRSVRFDLFTARKGKREIYQKTRDRHTIQVGSHCLDLHALEQLVESSQTRAIGMALEYCAYKHKKQSLSLADLLAEIDEGLTRHGLDHLSTTRWADLARFRPFELAAALNRLRCLSFDMCS